MMQTFQKPENALKRAEELQFIGQNEDALQILHSAIGHRTFRLQGWHILQEQIMLRYIEFCLHLERLSLVKDGLHQYRIICQHGNIASLGKVITDFRDKAEEKVRVAKENLMMAKEKNEMDEGNIDIAERILMPSLDVEITGKLERKLQNAYKICWDTYKMILDILRATPKLEKAYHETARKALLFCKENSRISDFKKLSDLLRNHYNLILKGKHKPEFQSLLKIEYHLETKIIQLQTACELQIWKEASNIAEDIYNLNMHEYFYRCLRSSVAADGELPSLSDSPYNRSGSFHERAKAAEGGKLDREKGERGKGMDSISAAQTLSKAAGNIRSWIAIFYEKMADMLFVYESELFHGLAWLKYCMHILNYKKNIPEEEKKFICTKSVLAVLAIPLAGSKKKEDAATVFEAHKKMSQLLGHSSVPVKESLKNGLKVKNILNFAEPNVVRLYSLIENKFTPLSLCIECENILKELENTGFKIYIKQIKEVIFHKLIVQLSKVYSYVSIDYFTENICPSSFLPWNDAENILVGLVYEGELDMKIDLTKRAIHFGSSSSSISGSQKLLKNPLMDLYTSMQKGMKLINECISMDNEVEQGQVPLLNYEEEFSILEKGGRVVENINKASLEDLVELKNFGEKPIEDEKLLKKIYDKIEEEHERIKLQCEENNKKRKEELKKQKEQELIQQKIRMEQKLLEEKLEREKREELARKGEKLRMKEEKSKKKMEAAEQMLKEIKKLCSTHNSAKTLLKGKFLADITIEDILNGYVDFEDIEEVQEKLRLKEKNEIIKIRRAEAKRVDHYFRACRLMELTHMEKWAADILQHDSEILREEQKIGEEKQKADFEAALKEKEEYIKFSNDIAEFTKEQMKLKLVEYERNLQAQKIRLYEILKQEKIQRARERKEQHIRKLQAEEERLRREEEEQQMLKEEMERKRKEEEKKKKEEERRRKLEEIARIQREKELEVEMKLKKSKEEEEELRNAEKGLKRISDEDLGRENAKEKNDADGGSLYWRSGRANQTQTQIQNDVDKADGGGAGDRPWGRFNEVDRNKEEEWEMVRGKAVDDRRGDRDRDRDRDRERRDRYRDRGARDYRNENKVGVSGTDERREDRYKGVDERKEKYRAGRNYRDGAYDEKRADEVLGDDVDDWRSRNAKRNESSEVLAERKYYRVRDHNKPTERMKENKNMQKGTEGEEGNESGGDFVLYTRKKKNFVGKKSSYMKA